MRRARLRARPRARPAAARGPAAGLRRPRAAGSRSWRSTTGRAVMNSAIPANSARTSSGMSARPRRRARCRQRGGRHGLGPVPAAGLPRPARRPAATCVLGQRLLAWRAARPSSAPASVPLVSAATTGSDFFLARRSEPDRLAGHVRRAPDAQQVVDELEGQAERARRTPRGSCASARRGARRRWRRCCTRRPSAPRSCRPPSRRHSSSVTSSRRSNPGPRSGRRSAADRGGQAARAAQTPYGGVSSSRSWARASSASPARIAGPTPNTVHAVGRCRRSVSPSMMSSCSSEKLCTSSTATAAGTARSGAAPTARADSSASAAAAPCRAPRGAGCRRRPASRGGRRRRSRTPGSAGRPRPRSTGPTRSRAACTAGRHGHRHASHLARRGLGVTAVVAPICRGAARG